MGAVFKVLDTEAHKILAIKMLRAQFVHNERRSNDSSWKLKAQVNYHIPDWLTFKLCVGTKGAPYCDGTSRRRNSCRHLVYRRPLHPYRAVKLFIQIAEAVIRTQA